MSAALSTASAATRIAARARSNPAKATSSARAISTASLSNNSAAAGRSASLFQGDRATSLGHRNHVLQASASHRASAKRVVSASATPAPVVKAAATTAEWKGAKLKPLGFSVLAGLIIWLIPAPAGVTAKAWHLLAVFVGTIVGIITNVSSYMRLSTDAPARAWGSGFFKNITRQPPPPPHDKIDPNSTMKIESVSIRSSPMFYDPTHARTPFIHKILTSFPQLSSMRSLSPWAPLL